MEPKRLTYLDIAQGFGIIFVVWSHAKGPFTHAINLFHMPLFLLISGYLYHSDKPIKEFLFRDII